MKMKLVHVFAISIVMQLFFLSACSNVSKTPQSPESNIRDFTSSTQSSEPDSETAEKLEVQENQTEVDALNKNDTGKTIIRTISKSLDHPTNSFMIISKSGTIIVADPYQSVDGIMPDAITSTHNHLDHKDIDLDSRTNCKKSYFKVDSFSVKDVKVFSIAASHSDFEIDKDRPSNTIFVFDVDGLRIAHMGDIGQARLTSEQMKALGKVDIAFMQFVNPISGYSAENERGIKLIEQLKPQIIIPTHTDKEATEKIISVVGVSEKIGNIFTVNKDDLKDDKRKVISMKNGLNQ